eukprot:12932511-Alexandrium_andersonii.AAC.1
MLRSACKLPLDKLPGMTNTELAHSAPLGLARPCCCTLPASQPPPNVHQQACNNPALRALPGAWPAWP